MAGDGLLTYVAAFILVNGVGNYVLFKKTEKKVITDFDHVKIAKLSSQYSIVKNIPDEIKILVKIIEEKVDSENLKNLYNNLSNVKVRQSFLLLLQGIKGQYNGEENILEYSLKTAKGHELLHLASSYYDKKNNICQSGFITHIGNVTFGRALNEGYTDLLTRRLFNSGTSFYNGEVKITRFFELLLNKKEMEKYYFNNDMPGLIKQLSNYVSREEAIKLITLFDFGFALKRQGNPAYLLVYEDLQLKLCNIYNKNKPKSLLKQYEYLQLLDESIVTKTVQKIKIK